MAFRKIEAGLVHADVDEFIGKTGTIFYDNDLGDFRISDGATPGGIALSFGSGEGGNYSLPTATTTVKGGVKIDGTTIAITNQVIRVGTVPYSSLSGTPTIPTNNNQLTNGAAYITSSALTGLATESYVTTRGYITTSALTDYALTSAVPTNNNQLTNGSAYITASSLTGLATETYVTTRGYLTTVAYADITNKPTLFSGSYADLTNKPTIPTDINQLADASGLLGQGGGGGGTTYITNTVENPFTFSVAGDDSTLREINTGESIKFTGAGGVTVTTDAEGNITITGTIVSLAGYATESYVTTQGYITSSALTGYALTTAIPTNNNQLTNGAGYITSGALTGLATETYVTTRGYITSSALTGLASETFVTTQGYITSSALTGLATETYVTSRGYITGLSWDQLTNKPNLAGTYSFNVAADDSTLREISTDETIKFVGASGITTASDAEGNITITGPSLAGLATETFVTTQGYITSSALTGLASESYVTSRGYITGLSYNDLTDKPNLAGTYSWSIAADDSTQFEIAAGNLVKIKGAGGITTSSDADGNITITGAAQDRLTSNSRSAVLNSNGTFSLPTMTAEPATPQAGQMALANGTSWDPIAQGNGAPYMVIYTGTAWIGMGGVTVDKVYEMILEMG
jgi:hypothetical protein